MSAIERKKPDWPSGQGTALAALCLPFLLGGIAGCVFTGLVSGDSVQALTAYLADWLELVRQGQVARDFPGALWGHLRWLLAVSLLGLTALGVAGLPLIFAARGFLLSFSVGCFSRVFGTAGLLPALALFALPALLWSPALFAAGFQGMNSAGSLLRRGMGDSRHPLPFHWDYWLRLGLCVCALLVCVAIEYWITPSVLRAAARVIPAV